MLTTLIPAAGADRPGSLDMDAGAADIREAQDPNQDRTTSSREEPFFGS
jgi:hypothetical protein